MANNKKTGMVDNELAKNSNIVAAELKTTSEVNDSASQTVDKTRIVELEQEVRRFCDSNPNSFGDYLDWKNLFDQFERIFKEIDEYAHSISEADYQTVKDKVESLTSELMFYNDSFMRKYNSWTLDRGREIEDRANKQQILNFAVFSLFMTLLTFLLSNIVVLTKTDYSIKSIVIVNLILLLVACIVFLFIGLFFGLIRYKSKKGYILKNVILCSMPFLIAVALIAVSLLM